MTHTLNISSCQNYVSHIVLFYHHSNFWGNAESLEPDHNHLPNKPITYREFSYHSSLGAEKSQAYRNVSSSRCGVGLLRGCAYSAMGAWVGISSTLDWLSVTSEGVLTVVIILVEYPLLIC